MGLTRQISYMIREAPSYVTSVCIEMDSSIWMCLVQIKINEYDVMFCVHE